MGWELVRKGESSHRVSLITRQFKGGELPQRLFLGFTPTDTWVGTYKKYSGWFVRPPGLRSITIDYGDGQAQTVIPSGGDERDVSALWHWNMDQLNVHPVRDFLPLLRRDMFGRWTNRSAYPIHFLAE